MFGGIRLFHLWYTSGVMRRLGGTRLMHHGTVSKRRPTSDTFGGIRLVESSFFMFGTVIIVGAWGEMHPRHVVAVTRWSPTMLTVPPHVSDVCLPNYAHGTNDEKGGFHHVCRISENPCLRQQR